LGKIGVCSALVASRSRARHRAALVHLAEMLGVEVIDSIPEFLEWLEVDPAKAAPAATRRASGFGPEVAARPGDPPLDEETRALVAYLFRDARRVELARLGGGFSGSQVFRTRSVDRDGRAEVPFVVKVDTHATIAKERVAVESVESLLGGASPVMADFVDLETLGAIKYGFASMHAGETRTLLDRLRKARTPDEVRRLFEGVFRVLALLHQAPRPERIQLFQHFTFKKEYAESTLSRARAIAGAPDHADVRALEAFYERLPERLAEDPHEVPVAMIHGDLNLANLLQDDAGNTWMIDYFWTAPGPVLQDAAKLENDLRFVAFPADDATGRREAALEALSAYVERLLGAPPDPRAHAVAALRYAAHSLSFEECDPAQKRAALARAAELARTLT
ncbi:MAG TPA: phosphotransferase, partial [Planctomycetota bacterium]|nr:phosphotransferase [Planctomycetota bacterium]